jgi:dihydrodipicolinate synthase/N-acetylneuraminate lyase
VIHLRDWQLPGFTTGSGCIAPLQSQKLLEACQNEDFETALKVRAHFIPLEDLRDAWGPARVLHHALSSWHAKTHQSPLRLHAVAATVGRTRCRRFGVRRLVAAFING